MAKTGTRDELLHATRQAIADWQATVASVPPAQLTKTISGSWSIKDIQAHLNADCRWMTGQLRALQRGDRPTAEECYGHTHVPSPGVDLADQDQRNAWRHAIDKDRPLSEVMAAAGELPTALVEAIAAVPEVELARDYTFGDYLHLAQIRPANAGEPAWPLRAIISSYADEHFRSHTDDLRRQLTGESNVAPESGDDA